MNEEDFERREEYEAPADGYEPDRLMMREEIVEDEIQVVEENAGQIESEVSEMGLFGKGKKEDDDFEEMEEALEEAEEEIEDEEIEEKPKNKKGKKKVEKKKKSRILPMLMLGVGAVLLGVLYVAWEMMSAPDPVAYQAPVVKPRVHPAEKVETKAKAAPQVNTANPQSPIVTAGLEMAAAGSALEAAGMEIASGNQQVPQAASPVPQQAASPIVTQESIIPLGNAQPVEDKTPQAIIAVSEGIDGLKKDIDGIRNSLKEIRDIFQTREKAEPAPQNAISKDILKDMTAEIQAISAQNKAVTEELDTAKKTIEDLKAKLAKAQKPAEKPVAAKKTEKKPEAPKETTAPAQNASNSWEILGFSGNRVVIADEQGTHSVNVGQSLNGIKIIAVDVESGSVKTSAGTLKYGQ